MLFNSSQFLLFFSVVFAAYWLLPWARARLWLLLLSSVYFYACASKWLALIVAASTTVDYFLARGIDSASSPRLRKLLLTINVVANLALLCYFKYVNFFLDSIRAGLQQLDSTAAMPALEVIVPLGLSFYTFEAINYVVDVYRGHVRAERDWAKFMVFILFFPHLVAGPIVRARDFLPQLHRRKRWSWNRALVGVQFLIMGLFKKLAIADRLAQFVDPIFGTDAIAPAFADYRSFAVWVAVVAYAIQIYCDFSGYTDMAIGCAHLLGYRLAMNFNMPYLSTSVSEFWRRWHVSLSSWLRDYLFVPLGGSRGGELKTARNLMLTMTLGGLWHGSSWTFVVWGVLHGGYLVAHRLFRRLCGGRPRVDALLASPPGLVACWLLTLLCVLVGWVFFRAQTFGTAAGVLTAMFVPQQGMGCPLPDQGLWWTVALLVVCHVIGYYRLWPLIQKRLPAPLLGAGYAVALTLALLLAPPSGQAFIYFAF